MTTPKLHGEARLTGSRNQTGQPTYAKTEITIGKVTFHAGDVVRIKSMERSAFADCVILGFDYCCVDCVAAGFMEDAFVRLARPYLYASGVETTCSSALTGYEIIDYVNVRDLCIYYRLVENGGWRIA